MPQAPADYQVRYPIDFGDIDASVRQSVVQLYAADGIKSRGLLYQPARGKPRTVVILAHPRADFAQHYSIPFWVEAGFAAFAQNTRYLAQSFFGHLRAPWKTRRISTAWPRTR